MKLYVCLLSISVFKISLCDFLSSSIFSLKTQPSGYSSNLIEARPSSSSGNSNSYQTGIWGNQRNNQYGSGQQNSRNSYGSRLSQGEKPSGYASSSSGYGHLGPPGNHAGFPSTLMETVMRPMIVNHTYGRGPGELLNGIVVGQPIMPPPPYNSGPSPPILSRPIYGPNSAAYASQGNGGSSTNSVNSGEISYGTKPWGISSGLNGGSSVETSSVNRRNSYGSNIWGQKPSNQGSSTQNTQYQGQNGSWNYAGSSSTQIGPGQSISSQGQDGNSWGNTGSIQASSQSTGYQTSRSENSESNTSRNQAATNTESELTEGSSSNRYKWGIQDENEVENRAYNIENLSTDRPDKTSHNDSSDQNASTSNAQSSAYANSSQTSSSNRTEISGYDSAGQGASNANVQGSGYGSFGQGLSSARVESSGYGSRTQTSNSGRANQNSGSSVRSGYNSHSISSSWFINSENSGSNIGVAPSGYSSGNSQVSFGSSNYGLAHAPHPAPIPQPYGPLQIWPGQSLPSWTTKNPLKGYKKPTPRPDLSQIPFRSKGNSGYGSSASLSAGNSRSSVGYSGNSASNGGYKNGKNNHDLY